MDIAVVILNWNGKALLEKYIPTVLEHSKEATIYLVDNASTDSSIPLVKEKFPTVNIIKNPYNGGFAAGYNMGLQSVEADIYCLLNSDVEVTANWLEPIQEIFLKQPEVSIVQPKILDLKRKEYFEYAGAGRHRHNGIGQRDIGILQPCAFRPK